MFTSTVNLCCLEFVSWCQEIPWKLLENLIADVYMYNDLCNLGFVRWCQVSCLRIAWKIAEFSVPLKHLNFKPDPNVVFNPSFGDVYMYSESLLSRICMLVSRDCLKIARESIADVYMYNDLCNLGWFVRWCQSGFFWNCLANGRCLGSSEAPELQT